MLRRFFGFGCFLICALLMTGCEDSRAIVSGVDERDANVIVVFLQSKGIAAQKVKAAISAGVGAETGPPKYDIYVGSSQSIEAMSILNHNGLPRRLGVNLLDLFGKPGLMSTEKEETIRYQAGLAQQLANMIMLIDGVIDADVQISFPTGEDTVTVEPTTREKITAAVFVKHQGVIDDPNSHLEAKIKRLISGSVHGLDINDVTVVSDRSRFTDVSVDPAMESYGTRGHEYVKIWSIVMSKESAVRFQFTFFLLLIILIFLAVILGWIIWKFYPLLRSQGGWVELLNPIPFLRGKRKDQNGGLPPGTESSQSGNKKP